MDDHTLKNKVETVLFRDADAPKDRVDVTVVDGVVELRGEVKRPEVKKGARSTGACGAGGPRRQEVALSASRSELLAHARLALDSPQLVVETALERRAPAAAAQHR